MLKSLMFLMLLAVLSFHGFAQTPPPTPPAVKEPVKANARPTPSAAKVEPFDKADVKTMAAQCVTFDTELGVVEMELFPEHAPESVRNFLNLAATGLFDTTTFGRVVPGFVIQGGDLYSRTTPVTYEIGMRARRTLPDEPNKVLHERGVLSMARGEEANTAMTSFFILVGPGTHLDGKFAAFGRVTKGMEVVDAINKAPVNEEKPEKPVRIKKATVAGCAGTRASARNAAAFANQLRLLAFASTLAG